MNDTEEVRRLFAAATADMPPGIDLLKGVRAGNRAQRTRTRVALSAGAAGIVAAATAITVSAVQAPSALAQVTQAAARTAGQSYRVSSQSTPLVRLAGTGATVTINGEFDPARDSARSGPAAGWRCASWAATCTCRWSRRCGTRTRGARNADPGRENLAAGTWAGHREGGRALEIPEVGGTTTGLEELNPQDLLALLQSSSQVSKQGPASGPGWTGTAYRFTASLTTRGPSQLRLSSTGTVDVDQQGRVRQLDATETVGQTVHKTRVTFGDFGLAVSVSPPPASETFTPPVRRAS